MPKSESGHVLIGEKRIAFTIQRSKRRRRSIGLLVSREGDIQVLAPARTGLWAIETMLRRHTGWIVRRLERISRQRSANPPPTFSDGECIAYRGERLPLRITDDTSSPQGCVFAGQEIIVNIHQASLSGRLRREEIRLEIMLWYRRQARELFEERTLYWSKLTGLRPRKVLAANPRRLWGSCTADNDVRLNWRLITAPPELLDYVIVHELCHIRHKDHSRRFWALVESILPGCKGLRKKLRELDPGADL